MNNKSLTAKIDKQNYKNKLLSYYEAKISKSINWLNNYKAF